MIKKDKILVVDDDINNLCVILSFLETHYEIMTAHNGKEALEQLESFNPDLILLDWNMPELDGLATLKYIKADLHFQHIQVIMMTGYLTEPEDLLTAYNHGVIDFIRKPFNEPELQARVKSVLALTHFYKKEVDQKSRELVSTALQLIKNKELISKAIFELDNVLTSTSHDTTSMIEQIKMVRNNMQTQLNDSIWQQFNSHFLQTNPDFIKTLTHKYPTLTPFEIKLCVLLYLNLDTKEIASILCQTYDSIRVSRTRLRKKLNLNNEDNLVSFLMTL